ncbi:MAG TPA: hypothetical protein VGM19_13255 [Armatimonadota bacterium]
MADKLVECMHCHGAKICKVDHGRSCEVCKMAAGQGRKGQPSAARCSFCSGHGRIWVDEAKLAEMQAEAEAAAAAPEAEPPAEPAE